MTRILPAARAELAENVGGLDAALRALAAVLIGAAAFGSLHLLDADWAFTLILHPAILAIYLLATAVTRLDLVYHAAGVSTLRPTSAARGDVRLRRSRARLRRSL